MANKKRKASTAAQPAVDLPKRVRTDKESITGEAVIPETDVNAIATAGGRQKQTSTGEQPQYFTRTMLIAAQKVGDDVVGAKPPVKRGRGRPRKAPKEEEEQETPKKAPAAQVKAAQAASPSTGKKLVSRLRKPAANRFIRTKTHATSLLRPRSESPKRRPQLPRQL